MSQAISIQPAVQLPQQQFFHISPTPMQRTTRLLAPAPPRTQPTSNGPRVTFLDLPAELRIEIYKRALSRVKIHILPPTASPTHRNPHALALTSRQVRYEVLPLMHAHCPIESDVTDFAFDGILEWLSRIPADQESHLLKNRHLSIRLCTSNVPPKTLDSLRSWLRYRADRYRVQPKWQYHGPRPSDRVCTDLRRRWRRMPEERKRAEMEVLLKAMDVPIDKAGRGRRRIGES